MNAAEMGTYDAIIQGDSGPVILASAPSSHDLVDESGNFLVDESGNNLAYS